MDRLVNYIVPSDGDLNRKPLLFLVGSLFFFVILQISIGYIMSSLVVIYVGSSNDVNIFNLISMDRKLFFDIYVIINIFCLTMVVLVFLPIYLKVVTGVYIMMIDIKLGPITKKIELYEKRLDQLNNVPIELGNLDGITFQQDQAEVILSFKESANSEQIQSSLLQQKILEKLEGKGWTPDRTVFKYSVYDKDRYQYKVNLYKVPDNEDPVDVAVDKVATILEIKSIDSYHHFTCRNSKLNNNGHLPETTLSVTMGSQYKDKLPSLGSISSKFIVDTGASTCSLDRNLRLPDGTTLLETIQKYKEAKLINSISDLSIGGVTADATGKRNYEKQEHYLFDYTVGDRVYYNVLTSIGHVNLIGMNLLSNMKLTMVGQDLDNTISTTEIMVFMDDGFRKKR